LQAAAKDIADGLAKPTPPRFLYTGTEYRIVLFYAFAQEWISNSFIARLAIRPTMFSECAVEYVEGRGGGGGRENSSTKTIYWSPGNSALIWGILRTYLRLSNGGFTMSSAIFARLILIPGGRYSMHGLIWTRVGCKLKPMSVFRCTCDFSLERLVPYHIG
jgi:hypothetical protein